MSEGAANIGGLVCQIHRNAVLQFESVPSAPKQIERFDEQIRELYNAPTIAESIVQDKPDQALKVCDTLAKTSWSMDDRTFLLDMVESLYES